MPGKLCGSRSVGTLVTLALCRPMGNLGARSGFGALESLRDELVCAVHRRVCNNGQPPDELPAGCEYVGTSAGLSNYVYVHLARRDNRGSEIWGRIGVKGSFSIPFLQKSACAYTAGLELMLHARLCFMLLVGSTLPSQCAARSEQFLVHPLLRQTCAR